MNIPERPISLPLNDPLGIKIDFQTDISEDYEKEILLGYLQKYPGKQNKPSYDELREIGKKLGYSENLTKAELGKIVDDKIKKLKK